MRQQLLFDLWDDPGRAALWESFPGDERDRATDLFARLAIKAAREASEFSVEHPRNAEHDWRQRDERHT